MNVLLTDIKAPAAPISASSANATSDIGEKNFRSMMQENSQSESKSKLQLVENNNNDITGGLIFDEIGKSELIPNSVMTSFFPEANPMVMSSELPVVGENLPVNGNSLPLLAVQVQSVGPISNQRNKYLHTTQQTGAVVQNMTEGLNVKGAGSDTAHFNSNSKLTGSDLLDSLTSKTFELNALQQTASDSSSARLQAAMAAINGLQNPSANPASANPVASTPVLSNSLERMVMTNPDSSVEWGRGLGERVSLMLNQKQNAATIRLDPPMLGKMDIQIQVKDNVTNVTINTQHAQTRDMVDGSSHRLREFLEDAGYQNVNVDVSHQSDQQKNDAHFMADVDSNDGLDSDLESNADELAMTTQVTVSNSLVDYFA
ncbi:MAG: flagellar hook-length control protein FliK [Chitinophagales bacterium]|jgi:flagellar hook-length control protein FliK